MRLIAVILVSFVFSDVHAYSPRCRGVCSGECPAWSRPQAGWCRAGQCCGPRPRGLVRSSRTRPRGPSVEDNTVSGPTPPGTLSAKYCEEWRGLWTEEVEVVSAGRRKSIKVDSCPPRVNPLVVGGKPASQMDFPHMAGLGFDRQGTGQVDYLCGGSLISELFVLTAAHCAATHWGPPVVVHLGSDELYSEEAVLAQVGEVLVHPEYRPPSTYHDIALVRLRTAVAFSQRVRPACLPRPHTVAQVPGALLTATGWGKQAFKSESSVRLRKVSLKVMHNYKCQEHYRKESGTASLEAGITSAMLCAVGHLSSHHDTCQGDSGGPVQAVRQGTQCLMELIGVTSFGKSCGSGSPGVYTRVTSYLPWIESIVWSLPAF